MKINIKIPKGQNGLKTPEYSLPEVNIYPNNRWGDIARSQGLQTARNWRTVKEGTTKGINDFVSDPRTQFVIGATTAPYTVDKVSKVLSNPLIKRGLDLVGTVDGATNLVSNNGVNKTVREYQNGNYKDAAVSALGDIFDISSAVSLGNIIRKISNPIYRKKHTFVNISPASYRNKKQQIKNWVGDMLSGEKADIEHPKWDLNNLSVENYIPEWVNNRKQIAGEARFDAWRMYNGLPQKYNTYIKNPDGTYAYDIKKIIKQSNNTFKPIPLDSSVIHDYVNSAGGNISNKIEELYHQDGVFDIVGNKNLGYTTGGIQTLEDVWDLHPFSRNGDKLLDRFPILKVLPGSDKLNTKVANLEIGSLYGGKPFKMHTEIPYTKTSIFSMGKDFKTPSKKVDYELGLPINAGRLVDFNYSNYKNLIKKLNSDIKIQDFNINDYLKTKHGYFNKAEKFIKHENKH